MRHFFPFVPLLLHYQLPSKQARQRTDGRTVAAAAWGGLESREAVFATTAVSFNDTKILAQKLHEMLRRLELALWSNDYYVLLRSRFFEASLHTTSRVPTIVVASARKCRKSATHMYVWYQCHWRSRCQGLCTVIPPPPRLFLLLLDVDRRQASRQTHLLPQEHRLRHGEEVLSELTLPINNNAVVSSTVICWRCSSIILKKVTGCWAEGSTMISTAGPPPKQGTNGVRGAQDPNDGCCDNAVGRVKELYDRIPPCTSKSLIDTTVKVAAEGFLKVI